MTDEARLEDFGAGMAPATPGWFTVNVRDAAWMTHPVFGSACVFDGPQQLMPQLGLNIRVLEPGQPSSVYHAESNHEAFLVLAGECLLIVEGQERTLRAWDFVHSPAGTRHVLVGAGTGPCLVLMAGGRGPDASFVYPVDDAAVRHGAGVRVETRSASEAYGGFEGRLEPGRPGSWDRLPWAGGGEVTRW